MKPPTEEWVAKAEADWLTAEREFQASGPPNYDAVAFHAQQCAEKYLKARLVESGIAFPKTHDLGALLSLILSVEPAWESIREPLSALTDMAVEIRYPGASASRDDAAMALGTAQKLRELARAAL